MNKTDLINSMAKKSKLSKKDSEAALKAFIASVGDSLKNGQKVSLVGFGAFQVRNRAAKTGTNPQTKKAIQIPPRKAPVFTAGKKLKNTVNPK